MTDEMRERSLVVVEDSAVFHDHILRGLGIHIVASATG